MYEAARRKPKTGRPAAAGEPVRAGTVQRAARPAPHHALPASVGLGPPNRTGLPDHLKTGVEALSGIALDDVRVHRNSGRPAQLQALAHTQGSEIHLGPGQEHHLPHEAWHVVQQKQGRVQPTMALGGTAINDDAGLEREAETMGGQALRTAPRQTAPRAVNPGSGGAVAQCVTVNVRRTQKMLQDQPPGTTPPGTEFGWDSKFDLDVVGQKIVVTLRIKTTLDQERFRDIWAKQVREQWSDRFAIKYDGETYPIEVKLEKVNVGHHYEVTAFQSDSVYGHGNRGHFGTQNMLIWGANDLTNVSHEVGHMLGNPDEYGEVEANGSTVNYLLNPSNTIMGKPANNPIAEHYGLIRETAQTELRRIKGDNKDATVSAYVPGRIGVPQLGFNPSQALGISLKSGSTPKPQPKEKEEESELSKMFASKKKVWTPSSVESISNSNSNASSSSTSYTSSYRPSGFGSSSVSSPKPLNLGPSSLSGPKLQSQPSPSLSISKPPPKLEEAPPKQIGSVSNSNSSPSPQKDPRWEEMMNYYREAKQKKQEYPKSWVVARLFTYIVRTMKQYKRGESQSWCVSAVRQFAGDIDQAIRERHVEGPWPSFMFEDEK